MSNGVFPILPTFIRNNTAQALMVSFIYLTAFFTRRIFCDFVSFFGKNCEESFVLVNEEKREAIRE